MSNKALTWCWDSAEAGLLGDNSGAVNVLALLADHGTDRNGEDWTCFPSVKRIMGRTRLSQSAIERHLLWLIREGWISRERLPGRRRDDEDIGLFTYTLHRARAQRPVGELPRGEGAEEAQPVGKLPTDGAGQPVGNSPTGAADDLSAIQRQPVGNSAPTCRQFSVAPRPPYIAEPKTNPQEPTASGRAQDGVLVEVFERVLSAFGRASKTAVSRPRDWTAWLKACALETPERIGLAADRYLAHCAETGQRPYSLRVWLGDERWEPWLADGYAAPGSDRPRWGGPGEIRDVVVRAKSEAFAESWLDPCHWDAGRRAIVAPFMETTKRFDREPGLLKALEAAGVAEIVVRSKAAAP